MYNKIYLLLIILTKYTKHRVFQIVSNYKSNIPVGTFVLKFTGPAQIKSGPANIHIYIYRVVYYAPWDLSRLLVYIWTHVSKAPWIQAGEVGLLYWSFIHK
jgi:hypothetical protein